MCIYKDRLEWPCLKKLLNNGCNFKVVSCVYPEVCIMNGPVGKLFLVIVCFHKSNKCVLVWESIVTYLYTSCTGMVSISVCYLLFVFLQITIKFAIPWESLLNLIWPIWFLSSLCFNPLWFYRNFIRVMKCTKNNH